MDAVRNRSDQVVAWALALALLAGTAACLQRMFDSAPAAGLHTIAGAPSAAVDLAQP